MINQLIKSSPTSYAKFRAWLTNIYKGDILKVKKFEAMNEMYLVPVFIKYLEEIQNVPVLEALNYYTKLRFISNYNNQVKNMILFEFSRIEQGKVTEYNIF
jgi:hypothetical protein